jgi:predicted DNA-binding protein (MmcQ/YjbR family)
MGRRARFWVASQPARFHIPAYLKSKGWLGLRLNVGKVSWDKVADLVRESYRLLAPKRLAALVGSSRPGLSKSNFSVHARRRHA